MMLASFGFDKQIIHKSTYSMPFGARLFGDGRGSTKKILRLDSDFRGLATFAIRMLDVGGILPEDAAMCLSDWDRRLPGESS